MGRRTLRIFVGLFLGGVFFLPRASSRAQEAGGKDRDEGKQALLAAARVYGKFRTYSDVTKVSILLRSQEMKQDRAMVYRVALERPNKLSVRLESGPAATTLVSDGQTLWTYYGAIKKYSEQKAPEHLEEVLSPYQLAVSEDSRSHLEPFELFRALLSAQGEEAVSQWKVRTLESTGAASAHLSVEDPAKKGSVQVWIGKEGHRLLRLSADITEIVKSQVDPSMASELKELEAEMIEEHDDIRVDEKLDGGLFTFTPPDGAEKMTRSELESLSGRPGRPEGKGGGYTLRLDPIEAVTPKELRIGEVGRGVFRNGEAGDGREAQAGAPASLPYDLWALEAGKKGTLRVMLDSEESDPVLYLLGAADDLLEDALSVDDNSGQGINAALFVEAEAGKKYFFAAARKVGSPPGAYLLRAEWHVPVTTPKLRSMEMGETHEAILSWDSAERLNHVHFDVWTFKATEEKLITVEVHSGDFVPALRLYREGTRRAISRNDEPSAEGDENIARLFFRAEKAASYRVEIAGLEPGELGKYKLTLEAGELPDPALSFSILSLDAGKAAAGKLTDDAPQGIWKVTVEKPTRAVLRAHSAGFAPALSLKSYHPSTPPLFRVDAGSASAALVVDLFPGIPYFITVDSENQN